MKLTRVRLSGVDRLGDLDLELCDGNGRPFDLVVVTGPRASGKTSLLEAIISAKEAAAPYLGPVPWHVTPAAGARSAKIRLDWALSDEELLRYPGDRVRALEALYGPSLPFAADNDPGLVELLREYDEAAWCGKVEYFHAGRRIPRTSPAQARSPRLERQLRLTTDDRKYAGIPAFLLELCLDPAGAPDKAGFDRALALLTKSVRLRAASRGGGALRPAFEAADGRELAVAELSHGDEQAVLFAATFVRSGVAGSVVLIDAPELFLASDEVAPFVRALGSIGAGNQLVVATGSRELVESVPPAAVIRLPQPRSSQMEERSA